MPRHHHLLEQITDGRRLPGVSSLGEHRAGRGEGTSVQEVEPRVSS